MKNKIALICYHSNAEKIYPASWVQDYQASILMQAHRQHFDIFEFDYGGTGFQIFRNAWWYESLKLPTFVHAMKTLIDECFKEGYKFVLNTNVDDVYHFKYVETMVSAMEKDKLDLGSSNFCLMEDGVLTCCHQFHKLNLNYEISFRGHNIISHPSVCYTRRFWETCRYNPEEIPREDLELWKRAIAAGMKMKIIPQHLLFHRIHKQSVCNSQNR
jgi:hypothetical protein